MASLNNDASKTNNPLPSEQEMVNFLGGNNNDGNYNVSKLKENTLRN